MLQAGIHHKLALPEYLADPCPEPSLSTSTVATIAQRSPLHAMRAHPRLGKREEDSTPRGDLGSAVHATLFGGAKVEFVGEVTVNAGTKKERTEIAQDWKSGEAKDARDTIRAAGNIPMLSKDAPLLDAICGSITGFLAAEGIMLPEGDCEPTLIWQENGVWHRGRADWNGKDGEGRSIDLELKTAENASPAAWIKSVLYAQRYDLQVAMRARGWRVLGKPVQRSVFLVAEIEPPFACSFVSLGLAAEELADREITRAQQIWKTCLAEGNWPAYGRGTYYAEPPAHIEFDALARGV